MLFHLSARLLAGVLFPLLFLVACSHTLPRAELPDELPQQFELTNTPFFAQQRYQCGPAALAMVLGQRGVAITPDELVAKVYLPERQGSVAPEMVATARGHGMVVYELEPSLEALLRELAAGNPVLVLQNLGLAWLPKWHYAVVVGYDLSSQQLILRSGVTERYRVSMALFDRTWQRAERWGITLLPAGKLPAGDAVHNYLKGAYALEQMGRLAEARRAYHSGITRWPQSHALWLAASNAAHRQQEYGEAEQTLREALHLHPQRAELWNNLAYALAAQGCVETAKKALECAVELSPEYLDSQREIRAMAGSAQCEPVSCP